MSKKLSGFSISYKNEMYNQYSNVLSGFSPDYEYRLGLNPYPVQFDSLGLIVPNNNQLFYYKLFRGIVFGFFLVLQMWR